MPMDTAERWRRKNERRKRDKLPRMDFAWFAPDFKCDTNVHRPHGARLGTKVSHAMSTCVTDHQEVNGAPTHMYTEWRSYVLLTALMAHAVQSVTRYLPFSPVFITAIEPSNRAFRCASKVPLNEIFVDPSDCTAKAQKQLLPHVEKVAATYCFSYSR